MSGVPRPALRLRGGPTLFSVGEQLGEGGEGVVYAAGPGLAAKIYRPDRRSSAVTRKLELMLATAIDDARLAWPRALVENELGHVVGYVMRRADGIPLNRSLFIRPLLEQHLPRWTRLELVDLSLAILDTFATLHRNGVLVGDVNGANILVGPSPRAPVLVDLDGCQIGDCRCAMGTIPFLAPRLLGARLADATRTFEDECFAIATLLFMVLVPGKPPYSHQGGGDPAENIRAGRFPYRTSERDGGDAPQGPWAVIWSHLPRALKSLFDRAFTHHAVVGPAEWQTALEEYRYRLLCGHTTLDIFPARSAMVAPVAGSTHAQPAVVVHPARAVAGTANTNVPSWASAEARRRCGAPVALPEASSFHTCKDCSASFELTAQEARWFASRALSTPRRCRPCRKQRRVAS